MKCQVNKILVAENGALMNVAAFNKNDKFLGEAAISSLKTDKQFVWINELIVRPECRDKGVGTSLVEAVNEIAKNEGADVIYAVPMTPANLGKGDEGIPQKKIEHFYKKQGFKECSAPKDAVTLTSDGIEKRGVCLKVK